MSASCTTPAERRQRPQRQRIFRCTFHIEGMDYRVRPLPDIDATVAVKAYRMTRDDELGKLAACYDIRLSPEGHIECECKGFLRWKHCKHVRTLQAMGCLPKEVRHDEATAEGQSHVVPAGV
jgi:hypothetical protein